MSTDPTQPMSPSASAGPGWSEQPEPQQREVPEPGFGQPRPTPPARPSFSPARPGSQPEQPAPQQGQPGSREARPGSRQGQAPAQHGLQQQQFGPQPGGAPDGDGGNGRAPRRRRLRRRWTMAIFALIVVAILLVLGDRVALAIAENDMANQFVSNGLRVKPSVTIEGFPFLTQLAARDFRKVDISASNIPAGPVTITTARATLTGMHLNSSFSGATVDHMTVTLFVSFPALAGAGGLGNGSGLTVTPAGPDLLKITANVGGLLSGSEEAKVTQTGPQQITVQPVNNGGTLGGLLNSFGSFTFSLPKGVPASLRITGITLNAQGLTVTAAADNASLSKPSS